VHILLALGATNSKPNEYKKFKKWKKGIILLVAFLEWIL
jgi:hypothetical protein